MTQHSMRHAARKQLHQIRPALFVAAAAIAILFAPVSAMAQMDHLDPEYAADPEPAPKPAPPPAPVAPAPAPHANAASEPAPAPLPGNRQPPPAATAKTTLGAPKHATIHPNCILDVLPTWAGGDSGPRSLERCEAENQDIKYETTENGMILMERGGGKNGYFAYHPVFEDDQRIVAVVYENTGGTATFSYLADVRFAKNANGTSYQVGHAFGGGDRCENGIDNVSNPPGTRTLVIKSDITPSSLFEVSKNPAYAQRAGNRDLPFCSYCCAGEATYQYEVGSTEAPKLVSLHFDPQKIHDMSDQTNVACFLKVLQNSPYVKDNIVTPDKSDLVLKAFLENCVR